MKSPFCGSVISSCFLKNNTTYVRFAGLSAGAGLFSLWLRCTMRGEAPAATVHCEGRRHQLAFVLAEQGTANSKLVMELFVIF